MLQLFTAIAERGNSMRTFAFIGAAALAITMMSPNAVWAWSSETVVPQGGQATNLADPDEAFKALQDKVNGGSDSKSGFYISGGADQSMDSPFISRANPTGSAPTPYGYSPIPGFRGR
jgi:hypothetical protein